MRKRNKSAGSDIEPALPEPGAVVYAACGGPIKFEHRTPSAVYHRQRRYFWLLSCQESFETNPQTSCLAGNPVVDEEI